MRLWIVIVALSGIVSQLFTCCADDCGAHITSAVTEEDEHDCAHHHEDSTLPSHEEHHLCVATHVFYVLRGHDDAPQPSWNTLDVALPVAEIKLDSNQMAGESGVLARSAPPLAALRLRAGLGVWTI